MRSLLISFMTAILILSSCSEKVVNQDGKTKDRAQVIQLLNQNKPDKAILLARELLKETPQDEELQFLMASAFAILGGIDVYTLFPVLEIKFFKEPLSEFENMNQYDNPYMKYFEKDILVRETRISESTVIEQEESASQRPNSLISQEEENEINSRKERNQLMADKVVKQSLNLLWIFYESVSIINRIPYIKRDNKRYIYKSIEILKHLRDSKAKRLTRVNYYLTLLSAIMLLSTVHENISLAQIKNPVDYFCQFDSEYFISVYFEMKLHLDEFISSVELSSLQSDIFLDLKKIIDDIYTEDTQEFIDQDILNFLRYDFEPRKTYICPFTTVD